MDYTHTDGTEEKNENEENAFAVAIARIRNGAPMVRREANDGLARVMADPRRIQRERERRVRKRREVESGLDTADYYPQWMSPEAELEDAELDRFYRRVLNSLKPRARLVFTMVRERGMPYGEVAMQLGITKQGVHWYVRRVQRRFRIELRKIGVEPPKASRPVEPRRVHAIDTQQKSAPELCLVRGGAPRVPQASLTSRKGVA